MARAAKRGVKKSANRQQESSAAAPSGRNNAQLRSVSKRLTSNERSISRIDAKLRQRLKTLQAEEQAKRRLESERDALRSTLDLVRTQQDAATEERRMAALELRKANAVWTTVKKAQRKSPKSGAIKAAVKTVESGIDKLRAEVEGLHKDVTQAEAAVSKAIAEFARAQQERQKAQDALQRIPTDLRDARRNLATLVTQLQSRPDDAQRVFATEREFRQATQALEKASKVKDADFVRALVDTTPLEHARTVLDKESKTLEDLKSKLVQAQKAVEGRLKGREEEIQARVRGGR